MVTYCLLPFLLFNACIDGSAIYMYRFELLSVFRKSNASLIFADIWAVLCETQAKWYDLKITLLKLENIKN